MDVVVSGISAEVIDVTGQGKPPNTEHALGYKTFDLLPVSPVTLDSA